MTTIRRSLLVISLVIAGGGLWALAHNNQLGPLTIAQPVLIIACVVAVVIAAVALVTESIMLLSAMQHPEPEDPPLPPAPPLYKPEPTPEPKNEIQKTLDAVEQAEEYLAQTRHRISVVIEEDDDETDPPKTPPTVA